MLAATSTAIGSHCIAVCVRVPFLARARGEALCPQLLAVVVLLVVQALLFVATLVALVFTTTTSPGYHVYFVRFKKALVEGVESTYEVRWCKTNVFVCAVWCVVGRARAVRCVVLG